MKTPQKRGVFFDKAHFTDNQNKAGVCPYCDLRQANGTVK